MILCISWMREGTQQMMKDSDRERMLWLWLHWGWFRISSEALSGSPLALDGGLVSKNDVIERIKAGTYFEAK
jgi:hypothetical protein